MNSTKPLVSIIVPSYNQGCFLKEALDSIISQTYKDFECIIIDDGSTDNTSGIASFFCQNDKRFKYIYQENKGVVCARNTAIKNSKGKYILPVDGDDKIEYNFVELAVNELEKNDNAKIVTAETVLFGEENGPFQLPFHSLPALLAFNTLPCSCLYRRKDYDKVGGYKEYMKDGYEDWDFWISILEKGGDVIKIATVGLYYRIKKKSRNSDASLKFKQLGEQVILHHPDVYLDYYRIIWKELNDIKNSRIFTVLNYIVKFVHPLCNLRKKWKISI